MWTTEQKLDLALAVKELGKQNWTAVSSRLCAVHDTDVYWLHPSQCEAMYQVLIEDMEFVACDQAFDFLEYEERPNQTLVKYLLEQWTTQMCSAIMGPVNAGQNGPTGQQAVTHNKTGQKRKLSERS